MNNKDAESEAFEKHFRGWNHERDENGLLKDVRLNLIFIGWKAARVWQPAATKKRKSPDYKPWTVYFDKYIDALKARAQQDDHHKESVRCMSVVMTDIANLLGIPAAKHGDPDLIFDAIEALQEKASALPAAGALMTTSMSSSKEHPPVSRAELADIATGAIWDKIAAYSTHKHALYYAEHVVNVIIAKWPHLVGE